MVMEQMFGEESEEDEMEYWRTRMAWSMAR